MAPLHRFATPVPHWAGLAPVPPGRGRIAPDVDRALAAAARAAHDGDRAARDALYAALWPRIRPLVNRYRYGRWRARQGRAWELADVEQLTYLVFVDLLAEWPAQEGFAAYFFAHFPWRLHGAVLALDGRVDREAIGAAAPTLALLADGSAEADAALALVEATADALPPVERDILLWRLRDGETFAAIATRLGLTRRQVHRRWRAALADLRAGLAAAGVRR